MELLLKGKHALVCGASSGIGCATAMALSELGAEVTVLARRRALLEGLAQELPKRGAARVHVLVADLDVRAALETQVSEHLSSHGPVHVLINNAGGPPAGPVLDAAPADFEAAFGRHVLASQLLVRLVLPGMRQASFGRIINIISTSVREPIPNLGVSNTIRGAMAAWSKTLSRELPPGVTVNNVLPGFTSTERLASLRAALAQRTQQSEDAIEAAWLANVPEGRLARPEEIAAVVAFLASPAASFVRGVSVPVDGGRLASL